MISGKGGQGHSADGHFVTRGEGNYLRNFEVGLFRRLGEVFPGPVDPCPSEKYFLQA